MQHSLAWLHWNPSREVFTIPIVNHPLTWYGVCFVAGLLIGYVVLTRLLSNIFKSETTIRHRDIINWNLLIKQLQSPVNAVSTWVEHKLDAKSHKEFNSNQSGNPSEALQQKICNVLHLAMQEPSLNLNHQTLAQAFPKAVFTPSQLAQHLVDKLIWFIVAGIILGARLGHVFFYDWPYYSKHPLDIIKVWEGGLASHGGAIGVIIALFFFYYTTKKSIPEISFLRLLDLVAIPTALTAMCIRIGNFFNQEILGIPTTMPWGVVFGNPADGSSVTPRHPVQLYEAAAYAAVFVVLYMLWKRFSRRLPPGMITGLFFVLVFSSRFFIEFLKTEQSVSMGNSYLTMGQYLSLPFIFAGLGLIAYAKQHRIHDGHNRTQVL